MRKTITLFLCLGALVCLESCKRCETTCGKKRAKKTVKLVPKKVVPKKTKKRRIVRTRDDDYKRLREEEMKHLSQFI